MRDQSRMTPAARDLLLRAARAGGSYGVFAEHIVPAAELIRASLCWADDQDDGPVLHLTDAGRAKIIELANP